MWKGFGLGAVLVAHFAGECPQLRRLKRVLRNDRWGREARGNSRSVAIRIFSHHEPPEATRLRQDHAPEEVLEVQWVLS